MIGPGRYTLMKRFSQGPWAHVREFATVADALANAEDLQSLYEPGEYDGRYYSFCVIDRETGDVVGGIR